MLQFLLKPKLIYVEVKLGRGGGERRGKKQGISPSAGRQI
jgi:hypothetical protein